ncbi:MAG: tetratricopeptide repeat protein, partial [Mariprofundaceae bacterium]
ELMQAEALDPKLPIVLSTLGYAWRLRGDFTRAEAYYKRAISIGEDSSIHTNYGSLLLEMKRFKEAEKELLKALDDPRYRNQDIAFINLGDAMLGQSKMDEAIDAYRRASSINPRQTISQLKEAEAYVKFGRLNFAQALYETLLRENKTDKTALEGLIKLLHKRHDVTAVRKQLKTYQQHASELERAWAADELDRLQ